MSQNLGKVFGIDLGTTYSCISYVDEYGKPVVQPNADSERITPSVVFFDGDNVIVGTVAKQHTKLYPNAVVDMVKRSMGDPNWLFEHDGRQYRPEEISSFILRKVVSDAAQALGDPITDVVITCPAWFGINQREATARAGEIAGLNVRSIINEPTAAAIAYGIEKASNQTVLVYDLGGGTFDITMIEVKDGCITVLCTGGDHELGGKDWDKTLVNYLSGRYQEEAGSGEDILADPMILQDLYLQAEQAKKILTNRETTKLAVTAGQRVVIELTREKFDELTSSSLELTVTLTRDMLRQAAERGHQSFDKILLVGGSTRMPQVPRRLKQEFPEVEVEMFDPDESVAKGAAIFGWKLALDDEIKIAVAETTGKPVEEVKLEEVAPEVIQEAREEVAQTYGLRPSVVNNAANTIIRNVSSKTFGIVATTPEQEEKVINLIRRNDPVPVDVTRDDFGTMEANQGTVDIRLMESLETKPVGEVAQATEVGRAELQLPPKLPAGAPLTVHFELSDQGLLQVTAWEPVSKNEIKVTIETAAVMSEEEVAQSKNRNLALKVS